MGWWNAVPASHPMTASRGGTPAMPIERSDGLASRSAATTARTLDSSASGADPIRRFAVTCSSDETRDMSSRCPPPAKTMGAACSTRRSRATSDSPLSPEISPAAARSARTIASAPAAAVTTSAPITRVVKPSIPDDWRMSSALPRATCSCGSISVTRLTPSRLASFCASAPPTGPAPITAIVDTEAQYCIVLAIGSGPMSSQVAIVTGASKGIGFAIAKAFVDRGMKAVLSARSDAELRRAQQQLGGDANALAVRADVSVPADAERLVAEAVRRFGGLDVLVNNAGIGRFVNVADMSVDEWHRVIETNLSGPFFCSRAAIPEMRRRGGGWIINITSLAGKNAFAGAAAYCASKSGLNAFSEALMQEVRHDNIRVSYVMPGSVSTGFGDRGVGGEADWKLAPEDVARTVVNLVEH